MAPDNVNPTPDPSAVGTPPTAAPNVSALAQPGPQAAAGPSTADVQAQMAPYQAKEQAATQKAADLANKSTAPPPPGPHARLVAMVQGLTLGLDSFGKALATHGREGGVEEVQQVQAAQQQQKIQAQAAREANKNTQIQQQLMVADTNHKLAQNVLFMATLPDEITAAHLKVAGEQQTQAITGADFQAAHGGMTPDEFSKALGGGPVSGAGGSSASTFFKTNAQQQLTAASKVLGADDPYVKQLQTVLSDPNAVPKDLWNATNRVQSQLSLQEKATTAAGQKADLQKKQQDADPLFKYQSDPKALADPGAQQALHAYIDNPANAGNINGIAQAKLLIAKAGLAQQHEIDLAGLKASATKNAEMAATAGDPKQAGELLASGDMTLADLKSRGSSPAQIIAATNAAKDYAKSHGFTYNAADEVTGEQILKGSGAQTFFGSARSLVQPTGMLDMLKAAHDNLGNQRIPVLNSITDWANYNAGTPELAQFKAAVLGAADDYAKVMSGSGTPSDTKFIATEDSFVKNMNNPQFDAAVKQSRENVKSQVAGRIADNRYIMQREGDILKEPTPKLSDYPRPADVSADSVLMQVPGGVPHWIPPQNVKAAQNAGAVEIK